LSNEVDHDICLDVFQHPVHVSNISTTFLHKVVFICIIHRNNNLLPGHTLGSYVDSRFRLAITFDHVLNVVDVLHLEDGEDFFDFENAFSIAVYLGGLCIQHTLITICMRWCLYLEKFGDLVDFFKGFSRYRRRKSLNTSQFVIVLIFELAIFDWISFQYAVKRYLLSTGVVIGVCNK